MSNLWASVDGLKAAEVIIDLLDKKVYSCLETTQTPRLDDGIWHLQENRPNGPSCNWVIPTEFATAILNQCATKWISKRQSAVSIYVCVTGYAEVSVEGVCEFKWLCTGDTLAEALIAAVLKET